MNFYRNLIWNQWRKTHIPKDLWYADQHNGRAIVVRAWEMEAVFRSQQNSPRKEIPIRPPVRTTQAHWASFVFSDLSAYRSPSPDRTSTGIVGSIGDFRTFCHVFPVQLRALEIPRAKELGYASRVMGKLNNPEDLVQVLDYARELCR